MDPDLKEVLELLASAAEIARREGLHTNWEAFHASVEKALIPFNRRPISPRTYRLPVYDPE